MYGYKCEYCDGTVNEQTIAREAFKHRRGFVILEDVAVGVCDKCGCRYYSAGVLKNVDDVAEGRRASDRMESIPVAHVV